MKMHMVYKVKMFSFKTDPGIMCNWNHFFNIDYVELCTRIIPDVSNSVQTQRNSNFTRRNYVLFGCVLLRLWGKNKESSDDTSNGDDGSLPT